MPTALLAERPTLAAIPAPRRSPESGTDNRTDSWILRDLVLRAREGDRDAWNAIVDEYSGLLWSVVRGFRLGDAQAADAVQTTWLRLVEHLPAIREPERLAGWLRTTARRVCLEVLRGSAREHPVEAIGDIERSERDLVSAPAEEGPEMCSLRAERAELVRRVVADLPERQRALIGLLIVSPPLSYEEISARLEMPIGSIGPTRARILARLRTALAAAGFSDLAFV
jgi:RNA polymerase sigma factor (sigma-70 family)